MSTDYILEFTAKSSLLEIANNIGHHFNLAILKKDSIVTTNGKGLTVVFVDMDEEDQYYTMMTVGMNLNKRIYLLIKSDETSYVECKTLMFRIVVYCLEQFNGDMSFTVQGETAILERRSSALAIDTTTPEYYPELIEALNIPHIVKLLEVGDMPDD
jgi:hypothetical protein